MRYFGIYISLERLLLLNLQITRAAAHEHIASHAKTGKKSSVLALRVLEVWDRQPDAWGYNCTNLPPENNIQTPEDLG
jgi:hypothetical protein